MIKACRRCFRPFTTDRNVRLYCSAACRYAGAKGKAVKKPMLNDCASCYRQFFAMSVHSKFCDDCRWYRDQRTKALLSERYHEQKKRHTPAL